MKVPKNLHSSSNNSLRASRHADIQAKGRSVVGLVNSEVPREKRVTLNLNNEILSQNGKVLVSAGDIALYGDKGLRNMVIMKLNPIDSQQFDAPKTEKNDEIPRTPTSPLGNRAPESDGFFDAISRFFCGL